MTDTSLESLIKEQPLASIGLGILALVIICVFGFLMYRQIVPANNKDRVAVVTFGDGQNQITVERNGTVTIKTPHGVFTQKWDPEKIRRFFENVDNLDFDLLTKFIGTDVAITLTTTSGKTIVVAIDEYTEPIANELETILEDNYQQVESTKSGTVKPGWLVQPTPTSTPKPKISPTPVPTSTPSSNPWQTGNTITDPKKFGCAQIDQVTGKQIIISNTVCIK